MANFEELLEEFHIGITGAGEEVTGENPVGKVKQEKVSQAGKGSQAASSLLSMSRMSGVFGAGNHTGGKVNQGGAGRAGRQGGGFFGRRRNRAAFAAPRIRWAAVGAWFRALPCAAILCTIVSIIAGLYIIMNFDAVTWKIFCFVYNLMFAGFMIFVLIAIILALILAVRRRPRWRW